MEKSKLENLGDSQLQRYLNYVLNIYGDSIIDIEDFYYEMTEDTPNYKKIASPFGGNLSRLDMEYIFMCFLLNGNDFTEGVYRPEFMVDRIDHVATVRLYQIERREIKFPTYLTNDAIEAKYLNTLETDGYINPWYVETYDTDVRDAETGDTYYDI